MPGLVSFTVIHILWAHGLKASVCSTAVILILFNKICLLIVGFDLHHSTLLAYVALVKDIHALGALLAGKYASLHSILVSAEKSPGTYA